MAVAATAGATLYAVREARAWVTSRLREDARHTAELLRRSNYAINPALLKVAADLTRVDVITFQDDGRVVASTFTGEVPAGLLGLVRSAERPRPTSCGASCFIAYEDVDGLPGTFVAVIAGRAAEDPLSDAAVQTIWIAGAVGVLLMVVVSEVLARMVTARIHRLMEFTRQVSPESTGRRAAEGDDDIGRLGGAFNSMVDRLADSRMALIRSEKLALAGLMAARVAHDVRNPLSSIKMQSQLLRSQLVPESEQAAMLAAVLRDVDQLDAVVRDLLETARPEAPRLERVRLAEIVRLATAPLEAQLAHRRIRLALTLDDSAPPMALDPGRVRRALVNVLTNSAEAVRSGGTIAVTTTFNAERQVVEVADDGVGLDPSVVGRVFDPFVSATPGGVGLGLVNARAIVESHGGSITLEPRAPRGTVVTITLPQRGPTAAAAEGHNG